MKTEQTKKLTWRTDDHVSTVTYVQTKRYTVDEKGLRRALTAKVYDKYTVKTLDKKALEAALDTGELDPLTVSRFVTEIENRPYLRFTEKEATEQ